jgi:hypothetical protein
MGGASPIKKTNGIATVEIMPRIRIYTYTMSIHASYTPVRAREHAQNVGYSREWGREVGRSRLPLGWLCRTNTIGQIKDMRK